MGTQKMFGILNKRGKETPRKEKDQNKGCNLKKVEKKKTKSKTKQTPSNKNPKKKAKAKHRKHQQIHKQRAKSN